MKPVSEALDLILSHVTPLPPEQIPLADALHRVLRQDVLADIDSPAFDCSSMDGYALRAADNGHLLDIALEIKAGDSAAHALAPGQCARIFTGAKIPDGADCVLMQEEAVMEHGKLRVPQITPFENIRKKGENCRAGDNIVKQGTLLTSVDLAALASCGVANPLVSRRPRVVHLVTGDELVDPSRTPGTGQIRDSNSILISSLLRAHGVELIRHAHLRDDLDQALRSVPSGDDFDILLISGGASVGDYDFARPMLEHAGFEILIRHVNMRPGKPLIFGVRGRQLAFGLPGNPVAHAVIFHLVLAPVLAALTGAPRSNAVMQGRVEQDFRCRPNPRETWWPAVVDWRDGAWRIRLLRFTSSGDVAGMAGMNALLRIPPESVDVLKPDVPADFLLLRPFI